MSEIILGKDITERVADELRACAAVVTDENVARLYPHITSGAIIVPSGEGAKTPEVLFMIIAELDRLNVKRGDRIAAVGGGAVSDVAGLAAALYMRGIDWISVPTTLLGMVDAGLGGKTAINFNGIKNLVGAFYMPEKILINHSFSKTLSDVEMFGGLGEIVKTCLLSKPAYDFMFDNADALCSLSDDEVFRAVEICVEIKRRAVSLDPRESGLRAVLNVGHTVGHALESADNCRLSHGEYVIKGLMTEAEMFREYVDEKFFARNTELFKRLCTPPRTSANAVAAFAEKDKKNGNRFVVMLPIAAGDVLRLEVTRSEFVSRYESAVRRLRK